MKKALSFLLMSALMAFCALPLKTEAATIALLPMVNNVVDYPDLNSTYYTRAFEAVNGNSNWEMVDSEDIEKYAKESIPSGQLATEQDLRKIAEKSNIDMVMALKLDILDSKYVHSKEDYQVLDMQGVCVAYNRLTGKFQRIVISENGQYEATEGNRNDWKLQEFSRAVTRVVNRAIGKKRISFEKPRISKAGFR